jgi:protein-S-isoprenylcysteine O-methyltransferase Ste14
MAVHFRATEFEFRNRFWLISAIFALGFLCYSFDRLNAAEALARLITRGQEESPAFATLVRTIFGAGAGLVVAAALVRSWATAYLSSSIVHDAALHSDRLVADGPFRRLRNPLYFGNVLLALGMGLLASRTGFAVIAIGMTVFCLRLIGREEAELLQSQGDGYRRYCQVVPRMLPALRARVPAGGRRPNWADGLASESFIWGFALGMAAFAVTLRQNVLWILIAAGFAARLAHHAHRKRRESR